MSDVELECKERILWIRGTLGVGKSIMAGYFIELLKYLHPTSIVGYFFCKSGQAGLTRARDIVRTLAFQCIQNNCDARFALQELKNKDFKIDENLGIGFLFKKLLREPLLRTKNDVYIILDGLDEAELTTIDSAGRTPRPEMDILIECLANLPRTRLLFISRPNADIARIVPNSVTKTIAPADNMADIDSYVRQTIAGSERLQKHFQKENIDAIDYFRRKANSVFLWVVLVLQQLGKAKSISAFKKYLNGFSQASGSMERLYSNILLKVDEQDREWIKEILRWLVVGSETFRVADLREAVELSLQDSHSDFESFLEVECGSVLHLLASDDIRVQLVHETLRSFLFNRSACPEEFYIDENMTHGCIFNACLKGLSDGETSPNFVQYAARNWGRYLTKVNESRSLPHEVVTNLYQFFESGGCKWWLRFGLPDQWYVKRNGKTTIHFPEPYLRGIYECLVTWKASLESIGELEYDQTVADNAAVKWGLDIVASPWNLGEYVGKTSAELWLYEDLSAFYVTDMFWLSLKSYCESHGQELNTVNDLQDLSENNFAAIRKWVNQQGRVLQQKGLGVAFGLLSQWRMSVSCLKRVMEERENPEEWDNWDLWNWLGRAYEGAKQYDDAIDTFNAMKICYPDQPWPALQLGISCVKKRDVGSTISAFEAASFAPMWEHRFEFLYLGEAYAAKGDCDKEIRIYEDALKVYPGSWWWWQFLVRALEVNGDVARAINTCREAQQLNPAQEWARIGFHKLENHLKNRHHAHNGIPTKS